MKRRDIMFKLVLNTDALDSYFYNVEQVEELEAAAEEVAMEYIENGIDLSDLLETSKLQELLEETEDITIYISEFMKSKKLDYLDAAIEFTDSKISMYISINYNHYFDDMDIEINDIETIE